ncbi:MAG TPA: hypothetical protein VJ771_08820 [Candidatus Nitrosotalea sp.]|nr:hypothetical protein [Candidatus Nitrosotalea sp.]
MVESSNLSRPIYSVFASGKLVCAGTRKESEVYRAVHNLSIMLQEKNLMRF